MGGDQQPGFRLARVRGIEIRIDWSLAFIFFLIAFHLGAGLFPAQHPDWSPALSWTVALAASTLFFGSVLAHELAHALVAQRQGIPVEGITLFIFGGLSRLRGEPPNARAEFLMAAVGPLTSLVIGIAATAVGLWMAGIGDAGDADPRTLVARLGPVPSLLLWLGPINVLLAIFNMLPGFPLDGGRVLRSALWRITGDIRKATRWASGVGRIIALGLVFVGMLMIFGRRLPILGGGLIAGLWLVFIGWFLHNGALMSYQQLVVRELLRGVPVARLMREGAAAVGPGLTVEALAERFLAAHEQRCFPVVDGGSLLGLVCMADLRKVPRAEWARRTVADVMTRTEDLLVTEPREEAAEALHKLAARDVDQLPVVEEGRLRGVLRRADVVRWLELRQA